MKVSLAGIEEIVRPIHQDHKTREFGMELRDRVHEAPRVSEIVFRDNCTYSSRAGHRTLISCSVTQL